MAQCSPDSPACFFVSESLLVLTTFFNSGIASLQCPLAAKESARSLLTGTLELALVFWAAEVTQAARSSPATIQMERDIAEIISRESRKSSTKLHSKNKQWQARLRLPFPFHFCVRSEVGLQSQLELARSLRTGDRSKSTRGGVGDAQIRRCKDWVIKGVVCLSAEFESLGFGNRESFVKAQINIHIPRTTNLALAAGSKRALNEISLGIENS